MRHKDSCCISITIKIDNTAIRYNNVMGYGQTLLKAYICRLFVLIPMNYDSSIRNG